VIDRTGTVLGRARAKVAVSRRRFELARHPVRPGDIVLLGDSITSQGDWSRWLPGLPIRNRAIGGQTSGDVLGRLRHELDHPAKLFLMVGTNDLGDGVPVETAAENVGRILATAQRHSPDTRLFVQSVLPRGLEFAPPVRHLNRRLEELAGTNQAEYIDLFPLFADEQGAIRRDYSDDALHLLPPGYVVWLNAIRPLLTTG
jgi:lysophospholipase L1-like esterase